MESSENQAIDVENAKAEYPRSGDVLFKPGHRQSNARLNYGVSPVFLYAEGYLKAGRILANCACESGRDLFSEHKADIMGYQEEFEAHS
jgi:hypothetical protein